MPRANAWKQVDQLLRGRPGWKLQSTTIPGASPVWCFSEAGEIELSVSVDRESIQVYEMQTDRGLTFDQAEQLAGWLRAYKESALVDRPMAERKVRRRSFLHW